MSRRSAGDVAERDEPRWRPLTTADIPAWARLLAAVEAVDRTGEHYDEDDLADELADRSLVPERDTVGVALPDGELVGYGIVRAPRVIGEVDRICLEGAVHPGARGGQLGRRVLGWLEERAGQAHRRRHPDVPGEFEVGPFAHVEPTVRLLARAGYTPVRWWNTMRLDLAEPPARPAQAPLAGLRLVPFEQRYDEDVRRAHSEAFAQHWGSSERDADEWAQWFTGQRAFSPATSFLALDGDQVAGYVLAYHWAAGEAATGIRTAYIGQFGTRPAWRGRGVASALLGSALAACREAGYQRAALDVDMANATGALGLYERYGFTLDRRRISHVKPLVADAGAGPGRAPARATAG